MAKELCSSSILFADEVKGLMGLQFCYINKFSAQQLSGTVKHKKLFRSTKNCIVQSQL